ncbi:Butyryl-CoA dehydrogenase [Minicystis rosea]|nr:Butyryl-CoA dehydrogenase [Minicystis rosea]
MDGSFADTAQRSEFRNHCRTWLRNNLPPEPPFRLPRSPLEIATEEQRDHLCAFQRAAYRAGLVGCDYPLAFGGGGRRDCQSIANEEMAAAGAPFLPNVVGLGMAGPTILHHGSEALKERLLPPLLSGDEIWCQGFSEPGAGSDLAGVQTFARRDGDRWIINGHKTWTSLAHFATWMILLCRTDRADKYRGLSYFVIPIRATIGAGVTVRPLVKMTGELGFNEVILEDLVVDDDLRLGAVGDGWNVAMTTLLHERSAGALVTPASGGESVDDPSLADGLVELARRSYRAGKPVADDPVFRDEIMKLLIRRRAFEETIRRAAVPGLCDHPMRLPLQRKLVGSELVQDIARLACSIEGMASLRQATSEDQDGPTWPLAYMRSYGITIAAGSSEVQRNILGERVLGLAKSR